MEESKPRLLSEPLSRKFGFDRGTPIERVYIDQFLSEKRHLIQGTVVEVGGNAYTRNSAARASRGVRF